MMLLLKGREVHVPTLHSCQVRGHDDLARSPHLHNIVTRNLQSPSFHSLQQAGKSLGQARYAQQVKNQESEFQSRLLAVHQEEKASLLELEHSLPLQHPALNFQVVQQPHFSSEMTFEIQLVLVWNLDSRLLLALDGNWHFLW